MLNIISRAWARPEAGAVHKVARNVVAGLESLEYPFVINRSLDYCSRVWIHDDYRAIMALPEKTKGLKPLLGPNLFNLPRDIPWTIRIPSYCVYLQPSEWTAQLWRHLGYNRTPIDVWPVGIDSRSFENYKKNIKSKVLFYYKLRDKQTEHGADKIETTLRKLCIDYTRIDYGKYRQGDYLSLLGQSKYAIWYGRQESQGLALQEALAMGCPLLVIDVKKIGDSDGQGYLFTEQENEFPATTAPYFDKRCGFIIDAIDELPNAIDKIESNLINFDPMSFIRENLSIEQGARGLLHKFDKWWPNNIDFINTNKMDDKFFPPIYWPLTAVELRLRRRGIFNFFKNKL